MILSMREKLLLFALGMLIIFFVGIKFLITPAYQAFHEASVHLSGLQTQQQQTELTLSGAKQIPQRLNSALDKADQASAQLVPTPDTAHLNVWLDKLAAGCGLTVNNIGFDKIKTAVIGESSATAADTVTYRLLQDVQQYLQADGQATAPAQPPSAASSKQKADKTGDVFLRQVTMDMSGSFAAVRSFLDTVQSSKRTVLVSSLSVEKNGSVYAVSAVLDVYGTQKPDDKDQMLGWTLVKPAGSGDLM